MMKFRHAALGRIRTPRWGRFRFLCGLFLVLADKVFDEFFILLDDFFRYSRPLQGA